MLGFSSIADTPIAAIPDDSTLRTNSLEGGTAGVTVSTGNSGGASGDAFNSVFIPSGNTQTYESNGAGGLVLRNVNTASAGGTFGYDCAGKPSLAARYRFKPVSGTWTGNLYLLNFQNTFDTNSGVSLRLNATQNLRILNRNGFTYPWVSTTVLNVGTEYQIELVVDTIAGTAGAKIWDSTGNTLIESGSATGQNFATNAMNNIRWSVQGTTVTTSADFDDIALRYDANYIGPVVSAPSTVSQGWGILMV